MRMDSAEKRTVADSVDFWEDTKKYGQEENPDYLKDAFIEDSFVKNGQAYLVISDGDEKKIMFYGNKLYGTFTFKAADYDVLNSITMKMIDSLEFYDI